MEPLCLSNSFGPLSNFVSKKFSMIINGPRNQKKDNKRDHKARNTSMQNTNRGKMSIDDKSKESTKKRLIRRKT